VWLIWNFSTARSDSQRTLRYAVLLRAFGKPGAAATALASIRPFGLLSPNGWGCWFLSIQINIHKIRSDSQRTLRYAALLRAFGKPGAPASALASIRPCGLLSPNGLGGGMTSPLFKLVTLNDLEEGGCGGKNSYGSDCVQYSVVRL